MKFKLKIPFPFAVLALAMGFSAVPMQAQWTVFDPTNLSVNVKNWYEGIQNGVKLSQTISQGTQLIAQGLSIYNLAKQETTALRHKDFMRAAGMLSSLTIPGHPDWQIALRSAAGGVAAAGAWQAMTRPGATLLNRVQMADAFGTSMVNSLGSCQAAALQSDGAIGKLESVALSMDSLDNTHAALGGLTNMGISQQLRIQECQHNLQQQQLQAQMIALMRQRDYENAQQTTYQNIGTISVQNPRGITNLSGLMTADFN